MLSERQRNVLGIALLCILGSLALATALLTVATIRLAQHAAAIFTHDPDQRASAAPHAERTADTLAPADSPRSGAGGRAATAISPLPSRTAAPVVMRTSPVQRCTGALQLVGSVVNSRWSDRSVAALRVRGSTRVARIGARIGARTLVALRPDRAYLLEADGSLCEVPVFPSTTAPASAAPPAVAAAPARAAAAPPLFSEAELKAGVRALGPDSYAVTRELLNKALGSVAALRRGARFRARIEDGRAAGIELVRVRQGSPLKHLGLQKGDVVRRLNGQDFSSPDGALQAYASLKSQTRFSLAITRDGAPRTMTYTIQ